MGGRVSREKFYLISANRGRAQTGGTATREMGDGWRYREAGGGRSPRNPKGYSAKIGLPPNGKWEIYPKSNL